MHKLKLLALSGLLLISACSSNPESKVVGKWENANDKNFRCELSGDHTGTMSWIDSTGKQQNATLKWTMAKEEKKVTVEANLGGVPSVGVFDYKDDNLVSPSGQDVYVRVK